MIVRCREARACAQRSAGLPAANAASRISWGKCHMYGLGVYLADLAQKSHRYVREPEIRTVAEEAKDAGGWWGVGANIRGVNGELWGQVVDDEGHCWRLDSDRIAKKETEGMKWNWENWEWDSS